MKTKTPLSGQYPTTFLNKGRTPLLRSLFVAALLGIAAGAHGADSPQEGARASRTFDTPLFPGTAKRLEGVLAKEEFFVRLPEHVRYTDGSELVLSYAGSPLLLPDVSPLSVSVNDRPVTSLRLGKAAGEQPAADHRTVRVPLDASTLLPGWNRVSIRCLLQTTYVPCRDVDNPAAWVALDSGSVLKVAYEPQALFPELQRFPDAITEPQLMHLGQKAIGKAKRQGEAAVTILMPDNPTDADLRAFLIGASRLAQTLYIDEEAMAVGDTGDFAGESKHRNGILIGTADALAKSGLPGELSGTLDKLMPGEGCVAEIITGTPANGEHRWIIVSGCDAEGLEKAAMALGSSPEMQSVPSNPWIITNTPVVTALIDQLAHPAPGPVTIQSMPQGNVMMRGLFRNQADRLWNFPPGYQTAGGSTLNLDISHAENLDKTSALDVRINDVPIGSVALTEANAAVQRRQIAVPAGIPGRDPSRIQLGSYLDIGTVDCGHRNDERAWLSVDGSSTIDIKSTPLEISDLSRLDLLLMRDAFLRRAVVLVPGGNDWERLELLKALGIFLGHGLPSMPVLWPQVATYGKDKQPDAIRVANRSGLILGSVFQWTEALPGKVHLAVRGGDPASGNIILRGQKVPAANFDRTLSIAQLLPSPWKNGELFATVGGIDGYGGSSTIALLTKEAVSGRLSGTVAAVDSKDRVIAYDVRYVQGASLAEHIEEGMPPGMTVQQTEDRKQDKAAAGLEAIRGNQVILASCAVILLGIFLLQRLASRRKINGVSTRDRDEK